MKLTVTEEPKLISTQPGRQNELNVLTAYKKADKMTKAILDELSLRIRIAKIVTSVTPQDSQEKKQENFIELENLVNTLKILANRKYEQI